MKGTVLGLELRSILPGSMFSLFVRTPRTRTSYEGLGTHALAPGVRTYISKLSFSREHFAATIWYALLDFIVTSWSVSLISRRSSSGAF